MIIYLIILYLIPVDIIPPTMMLLMWLPDQRSRSALCLSPSQLSFSPPFLPLLQRSTINNHHFQQIHLAYKPPSSIPVFSDKKQNSTMVRSSPTSYISKQAQGVPTLPARFAPVDELPTSVLIRLGLPAPIPGLEPPPSSSSSYTSLPSTHSSYITEHLRYPCLSLSFHHG